MHKWGQGASPFAQGTNTVAAGSAGPRVRACGTRVRLKEICNADPYCVCSSGVLCGGGAPCPRRPCCCLTPCAPWRHTALRLHAGPRARAQQQHAQRWQCAPAPGEGTPASRWLPHTAVTQALSVTCLKGRRAPTWWHCNAFWPATPPCCDLNTSTGASHSASPALRVAAVAHAHPAAPQSRSYPLVWRRRCAQRLSARCDPHNHRYYGPATELAVRRWQARNGLSPNGYWGVETRAVRLWPRTCRCNYRPPGTALLLRRLPLPPPTLPRC